MNQWANEVDQLNKLKTRSFNQDQRHGPSQIIEEDKA